MLPNGLDLLNLARANPEPSFEASYLKNFLVITEQPDVANDLMEANRQVLDRITAYEFAQRKHHRDLCESCIEDIINLLQVPGMNYSEFVSFWPVYDTTYSAFMKLDATTQRRLLHDLIKQFLTLRHHAYRLHGYTATTLQVQADSFAHKHSGSLGRTKIESLLRRRGFRRLAHPNTEHLADVASQYILPDGGDKQLFQDVCTYLHLRFAWGKKHNGKLPDTVIFTGSDAIIIEHKHIKEGGGGQDKQLVELIDFIEQSERNSRVHYTAFLDGTMANTLLAQPTGTSNNKHRTQIKRIERALRAHPQNYFVNTAGFKALLDTLKS